jgi:uncharacterized membrane protein
MPNELLVFTFERSAEARRVYDALRAMRRSALLALEQAVIVTKDRAGKVMLYQEQELPAVAGATERDLLRNLAGLVFGVPSEGIVCTLAQAGLDERFLEQLARDMGNDSSALLFLVPPDNIADVDELSKALTLFTGKMHRTILSPEAEAALLNGEALA